MKYRKRIYYTEADKALMWDRSGVRRAGVFNAPYRQEQWVEYCAE